MNCWSFFVFWWRHVTSEPAAEGHDILLVSPTSASNVVVSVPQSVQQAHFENMFCFCWQKYTAIFNTSLPPEILCFASTDDFFTRRCTSASRCARDDETGRGNCNASFKRWQRPGWVLTLLELTRYVSNESVQSLTRYNYLYGEFSYSRCNSEEDCSLLEAHSQHTSIQGKMLGSLLFQTSKTLLNKAKKGLRKWTDSCFRTTTILNIWVCFMGFDLTASQSKWYVSKLKILSRFVIVDGNASQSFCT